MTREYSEEREHSENAVRGHYTQQDYIGSLQQAWALAAENAVGLTEQRYSQLVATGQIEGPSAVRVIQVFQTWHAALDAAQVPAVAPMRTYHSTWTDEEMLLALREYLNDPSTSGSYAGWDGWRRVARPDAPSAQTLRNRLGPWSQAKVRALNHQAPKGDSAQ